MKYIVFKRRQNCHDRFQPWGKSEVRSFWTAIWIQVVLIHSPVIVLIHVCAHAYSIKPKPLRDRLHPHLVPSPPQCMLQTAPCYGAPPRAEDFEFQSQGGLFRCPHLLGPPPHKTAWDIVRHELRFDPEPAGPPPGVGPKTGHPIHLSKTPTIDFSPRGKWNSEIFNSQKNVLTNKIHCFAKPSQLPR